MRTCLIINLDKNKNSLLSKVFDDYENEFTEIFVDNIDTYDLLLPYNTLIIYAPSDNNKAKLNLKNLTIDRALLINCDVNIVNAHPQTRIKSYQNSTSIPIQKDDEEQAYFLNKDSIDIFPLTNIQLQNFNLLKKRQILKSLRDKKNIISITNNYEGALHQAILQANEKINEITLSENSAHNFSYGGAENDTFFLYNACNDNFISGGTGNDSFHIYSNTNNIVHGDIGDDGFHLFGDSLHNIFAGGTGVDVFYLLGNSQYNTLLGSQGNDYFHVAGYSAYNNIYGGFGGDFFRIYDNSHNNSIYSGPGNDTFFDTIFQRQLKKTNTFNGGVGNDYFLSLSPATQINGNEDSDIIFHYRFGEYKDTTTSLFGNENNDIIIASGGPPNIFVMRKPYQLTLDGGEGDDLIFPHLTLDEFSLKTNLHMLTTQFTEYTRKAGGYLYDKTTELNNIVISVKGGKGSDNFIFDEIKGEDSHIHIEDYNPDEDHLTFPNHKMAHDFLSNITFLPIFTNIEFTHHNIRYHFNTKKTIDFSVTVEKNKDFGDHYPVFKSSPITYQYKIIDMLGLKKHLTQATKIQELNALKILQSINDTHLFSIQFSEISWNQNIIVFAKENLQLKQDEKGKLVFNIRDLFEKKENTIHQVLCESLNNATGFPILYFDNIPEQIKAVIVYQHSHKDGLYFTTSHTDKTKMEARDIQLAVLSDNNKHLTILPPEQFFQYGNFQKRNDSNSGSMTLEVGFVLKNTHNSSLTRTTLSAIKVNF